MDMDKTYDSKAVEPRIYDKWIEADAFAADPADTREPFCMVIPPPNVTAALHLGHALNNTLQDVLIRYRRMTGKATLWMPGTDHAGIATQTVVEKRVLAEQGKRRTDFARDEFIGMIQEWKDEYEVRILSQLKAMGCSCDWDRTRFTMDDTCATAVRETFFRLFKDELIFRGKRLVNWDPATQTVLADDEVEHQDVAGFFWYLRYPLTEPVEIDGQLVETITVATTRPETMLGDTAVAMNPSDPRAKFLVGQSVRLPIVGRVIPIIADEHVVMADPESSDEKAKFSTGFLKVTPAHDPDDYQIGLRHDLPMINILAPDGTISNRYNWDDWADCDNPDSEAILGLDRFEARKVIVDFFDRSGLLESIRDYTHPVGHSYRSHVPIEPYLSDQWYVGVKKQIASMDDLGLIGDTDVPVNSLAGLALQPILDGRLKFTPERYAKTYQTWLENLRDWPISRQLWWGHQIPIWSRPGNAPANTESVLYREMDTDDGVVTFACVAVDNEAAEAALVADGFTRDADVLDTWFSSALWPFSTLGWPEQTPLLDKFYPGSVLSTAREIITLWVSRMVMMGQYCVGDIPFTEVFIHAMIQDGQGRKMSKSLGNGVDPLEVIDSHGADAMRYTLVSMTTQTQDVRMPLAEMKLPDGRISNSSPKFDIGRNLANKLWNASRFVLGNLDDTPSFDSVTEKSLGDKWILSRLNTTIRDMTAALENYRFNEMTDKFYHFLWDDFCDWYVEIAKIRIHAGEAGPKAIVAYCLDSILRLAHPMMPYITEEIWSHLNAVVPTRGPGDATAGGLLIRAAWPTFDEAAIDPAAEAEFAIVAEAARAMRSARSASNVPPSKVVDIIIETPPGNEMAACIVRNAKRKAALLKIGTITTSDEPVAPPAGSASVTTAGVKIFLLDIVDTAAEKERLTKLHATLTKGIAGSEGKLSNDKFVNGAPEAVVAAARQRLEEMKAELDAINQSLEQLG